MLSIFSVERRRIGLSYAEKVYFQPSKYTSIMIDEKYCLSQTETIIPSVPVGIIGVGSYLPPTVVRNSDFKNITLSDEEQQFMRTHGGYEERRWSNGETYTDMAIKAAQDAIQNAGIDILEVNMVVVTHISRDIEQLTPPNSVYIQTALGARNATAINVDQGFTSWMYALITGASFIASGFYKTVLVVSGETILPNTNSKIMKSMLVGDGAGAFVLRRCEQGYGMLGYHMMSDQYPEIAAGVRVGRAVAAPFDTEESLRAFFTIAPNSFQRDFPFVVNFLPYSVHKCLGALSIEPETVDHYIFAQKMDYINRTWAANVGVDYSKVHETIAKTACVETSSIPIITKDAQQKGKLKKGDLVLFADLGSNWSVASALFRWCI